MISIILSKLSNQLLMARKLQERQIDQKKLKKHFLNFVH